MKRTLLTASIATILTMSTGVASAALYVHQDAPRVKADVAKKDSFVIVHESPEAFDNRMVAKQDSGKEPQGSGLTHVESKSPVLEKRSFGKEPSEKYFEDSKAVAKKDNIKVSPYNHEVITPEKHYVAKMEKGFLSNGMRQHMEDMGWDMQWSSGSDRKVTVPYTIEYKDAVDYVTQVSGLYGITVDVYPQNKTIHVQD